MEKQANASHKGSQGGTSEWGELLNTTFVPPFSLKGWLFILAGLVPALIVGWVLFPLALYSSQPQPFNFSHVIHTDPDIGIEGETEQEVCLYCHAFRGRRGRLRAYPSWRPVPMCHGRPGTRPWGDTEDEKIFSEGICGRGTKRSPGWSIPGSPIASTSHTSLTSTNGEIACGHCPRGSRKTRRHAGLQGETG